MCEGLSNCLIVTLVKLTSNRKKKVGWVVDLGNRYLIEIAMKKFGGFDVVWCGVDVKWCVV